MLNYESFVKTMCLTRDRETKWLNRLRKYDSKCQHRLENCIVSIYMFGGRQDSLTASESQTMTFKSFDVGAKAIQCQISE